MKVQRIVIANTFAVIAALASVVCAIYAYLNYHHPHGIPERQKNIFKKIILFKGNLKSFICIIVAIFLAYFAYMSYKHSSSHKEEIILPEENSAVYGNDSEEFSQSSKLPLINKSSNKINCRDLLKLQREYSSLVDDYIDIYESRKIRCDKLPSSNRRNRVLSKLEDLEIGGQGLDSLVDCNNGDVEYIYFSSIKSIFSYLAIAIAYKSDCGQ